VLTDFLGAAREWARGRAWLGYALLLLVLVYLEYLKITDVTRWTIFYGITLGFHEMGHLAFSWAPQFIAVLMGSVFQIAVPIAVIVIFHRQEEFFGITVGGFWLSYSLAELSAYIADARSQELPLVGFASQEDLEHDWHYLLGKLHLLELDHFLGFLTRASGVVIGIASCAFGVWLIVQMVSGVRPPRPHTTRVK